jgi:SRSO17 transposase
MATVRGGGADLDRWLVPFLEVLGRKTRRTWAPLYLRGLLGPGERKSLQPMAARLGLGGHDQLQHFIASPAWDDRPLWSVLAREANKLVGGPAAWLRIPADTSQAFRWIPAGDSDASQPPIPRHSSRS